MSPDVGADAVQLEQPQVLEHLRLAFNRLRSRLSGLIVIVALLGIAILASDRLQEDRDWLSFLLTHQAEAFGLVAAICGAIAAWLVPMLAGPTIMLIELRRRQPMLRALLRWALSGTWYAVTLIALVSGALGYLVGRSEPVPKTLALEFPQPDCERQSSTVLIFLHGWRGDPLDTWRRFPELACHDAALQTVTIMSLNYPTYVFDRNLSMAQTASWINKRLIARGYDQRERIVIIAHSLGGLVARRMILDRRPELRGKVKGLVEIATPHLGPADYTGLISILGLKGADIVEEMRARSKSLETLQDEWNRFPQSERAATVCFAGRGDRLVSRESALFQCDAFEYLPEGGHTELVKPKDAGDDRYALPIHDVKVAFGL
jgi:pimeloyl-ACP methyl ester carboxylesterase